MKFQILTIS